VSVLADDAEKYGRGDNELDGQTTLAEPLKSTRHFMDSNAFYCWESNYLTRLSALNLDVISLLMQSR